MRGISIIREVRVINHSQFADDTLLLGGALLTIARRVKEVLETYSKESRGLTKKSKIHIYGWHTSSLIML
jgi:hypothetical protein